MSRVRLVFTVAVLAAILVFGVPATAQEYEYAPPADLPAAEQPVAEQPVAADLSALAPYLPAIQQALPELAPVLAEVFPDYINAPLVDVDAPVYADVPVDAYVPTNVYIDEVDVEVPIDEVFVDDLDVDAPIDRVNQRHDDTIIDVRRRGDVEINP